MSLSSGTAPGLLSTAAAFGPSTTCHAVCAPVGPALTYDTHVCPRGGCSHAHHRCEAEEPTHLSGGAKAAIAVLLSLGTASIICISMMWYNSKGIFAKHSKYVPAVVDSSALDSAYRRPGHTPPPTPPVCVRARLCPCVCARAPVPMCVCVHARAGVCIRAGGRVHAAPRASNHAMPYLAFESVRPSRW